MMSKHYQKITTPIHRSTAYDFNVQLDHYSLNKPHQTFTPQGVETDVLGVKEHEILVRYKNMHNKYKDNRLRVFSALNNFVKNDDVLENLYDDDPGAWVDGAPKTTRGEKITDVSKRIDALMNGQQGDRQARCSESLNRVMHRHLCYVGIAITPQNLYPLHSRQDSQGFAASRGGLNTILNTGNQTIRPGQKIKIDFALPDHVGSSAFISPSHYSRGTPHDKILAQTIPVQEIRSNDASLNRILDSMFHAKNPLYGQNTFYVPLITRVRMNRVADGAKTAAIAAANAMPVVTPQDRVNKEAALRLARVQDTVDKSYSPKVMFLRMNNADTKYDKTMDLDTIDASLISHSHDYASELIDRTTPIGRIPCRLIRFHANDRDDFEFQVNDFMKELETTGANPDLKFFCFWSRHIEGDFLGLRLDRLTGGFFTVETRDGVNWVKRENMMFADGGGVPQPATMDLVHPLILGTPTPSPLVALLQTDKMPPILNDPNQRLTDEQAYDSRALNLPYGANAVPAFSVAVRLASRSGDALHYALAVMRRSNFKGYAGAHSSMADFVRDTVSTTMKVMQSESEQTIGIALSGANIGEPFDICLTDH